MIKSPEIDLWAAVLERAIDDLFFPYKPKMSSNMRDWVRIKDDAEKWINSDSMRFGSFRCVCDILGLDPWVVRNKISKMDAADWAKKDKIGPRMIILDEWGDRI